MAALDASALSAGLSSIVSGISNINLGDIAANLAMGAIATTAVAGAQTSAGQSALDPLHIFHKDGSQTIAGPKPTVSAAAFAAMPAATQQLLISQGVAIVG